MEKGHLYSGKPNDRKFENHEDAFDRDETGYEHPPVSEGGKPFWVPKYRKRMEEAGIPRNLYVRPGQPGHLWPRDLLSFQFRKGLAEDKNLEEKYKR